MFFHRYSSHSIISLFYFVFQSETENIEYNKAVKVLHVLYHPSVDELKQDVECLRLSVSDLHDVMDLRIRSDIFDEPFLSFNRFFENVLVELLSSGEYDSSVRVIHLRVNFERDVTSGRIRQQFFHVKRQRVDLRSSAVHQDDGVVKPACNINRFLVFKEKEHSWNADVVL